MQMPYVSIAGSAGDTGPEELDPRLRHPHLQLYAVGSDSLAGRDATALDPRLNRNGGKRVPRLITNAAALACEADITFLCLSHEEAAALEPPSRGVVVDLSGAHRLTDAAGYEQWYGFTHPRPEELGGWSYGLPELSPPAGRLLANPGRYATPVLLALAPLAGAPRRVLGDRGPARAGAARGRDRQGECGRRRDVRDDRRGSLAAAVDARRLRAGERVAVQGRLAPARRGDRAAARLPRLVHAAPAARPQGAHRDVQRPLDRRGPAGAPRGALCDEPGRGGPPGGRRAGALPRADPARGGERHLCRPLHRSDDRDLRARQPREGRGRPGDPERQR